MKKVHSGVYWEGNHDGDGFYLPLCGQSGFSYETKHLTKHSEFVAPESATICVTCKRCKRIMKGKGK